MARKKATAAGRKPAPGKQKAKLLSRAPSPAHKREPDPLPPRVERYLTLADETLQPEQRQRSVVDVQPVFQPPKPPRLQTPKLPSRPKQPTPPRLTLPKPPKSPKAPRPISSLPKKRGRP